MKTKNPYTLNSKPYTGVMLSEHFSLAEFERSNVASTHGIDNTVPLQYIPTLQQLCRTILEPLRAFAGGPIIITSGYRSNALNIRVGGVYASQHTLGEAADIRLPDRATGQRYIEYIQSHCTFDQLILERKGTTHWLHISCRKNPKKNRHQVLTINK